MGYLKGKRILILGVASKLSIASGIAAAMHREGAELAFTYQGDRLKNRVTEMAEIWGSNLVFPCDVTADDQITDLFAELSKSWDGLDGLVHCLAFAPAHELDGNYVDVTTREGFLTAHEISSYSLVALAKAAKPMLLSSVQPSVLTLSYLGAVRSLPNYNVMGLAKASLEANVRYMASSMGTDNIRVNAISAGPIKTLASAGVKSFKKMLQHSAEQTPLRRNVTITEVGNAASFLCSDLASGISGEILYVDGGFNTTAMGSLNKLPS
ncbi:MAG: enoyl-ACP reductase [Gammaproteobacteria bacterium]|nr:enoyl-ACP reductase [Gammaproteobacteria bacterium]